MKRYKILDIHPKDAFYEDKDKIIGKVWELNLEEHEYISGWRSSRKVGSLFVQVDKDDFNLREFFAIKVEEVEE